MTLSYERSQRIWDAKEKIASYAFKYLCLTCIAILGFSIRLFSVVRYESVIHEFDPYFNYRVTQFLSKEGFYNLWNWFDDRTWYPLGRVIGGTVYPVCATWVHGDLTTCH